ncbi:hypothetical protein C8J32_104240 [Rhizobium sp. PP-CC-3A-592]|nr:hypothetical protein C8J32_104240 [Rhizobium sp. PP-CC-3A-592]
MQGTRGETFASGSAIQTLSGLANPFVAGIWNQTRVHELSRVLRGATMRVGDIIMKRILASAGIALAIAAGGTAGFAGVANAQGVELRVGPDGIRPVIREPRRERGRDRCGEREARAAARESGLRDPEVVRVTERRVVVEGMTRRGPQRITFANRNGCPEI